MSSINISQITIYIIIVTSTETHSPKNKKGFFKIAGGEDFHSDIQRQHETKVPDSTKGYQKHPNTY